MQDMQSLAKQLVSGLDQEGRCLERAAREELGELSANWAGKRAAEVAALREMAERFCEDLRRTERLARLGELAASVAHEIRNPLCGMMLSMEVLQTKMDADDSRNVLLENLRHEAERMEKIVANLLLFARDYQPHMIPSPLRQVVDATIESVQSHLRRKSIDVQVRSTDGACEAEVDPELIQQVFRNLLLNAIDAAPAASRLEIVIQNGVGEDEVAVAFHDEAGGIDENTLGRIFEPFFTSKAKGTGLGLAVSKKIVEVLGGRIEVQSQLGKGTSFTVALPRTHEKGAGVCAGCS